MKTTLILSFYNMFYMFWILSILLCVSAQSLVDVTKQESFQEEENILPKVFGRQLKSLELYEDATNEKYFSASKRDRRLKRNTLSNNLSKEDIGERNVEHNHRHQHGIKNHQLTSNTHNHTINKSKTPSLDYFNEDLYNEKVETDLQEIKKLETVVAKTIENDNRTFREEFESVVDLKSYGDTVLDTDAVTSFNKNFMNSSNIDFKYFESTIDEMRTTTDSKIEMESSSSISSISFSPEPSPNPSPSTVTEQIIEIITTTTPIVTTTVPSTVTSTTTTIPDTTIAPSTTAFTYQESTISSTYQTTDVKTDYPTAGSSEVDSTLFGATSQPEIAAENSTPLDLTTDNSSKFINNTGIKTFPGVSDIEEENYDDEYDEDDDVALPTKFTNLLPTNDIESVDYETSITDGTTVRSTFESTRLTAPASSTERTRFDTAEDFAEVINTPPFIKNRIPKIPVTAGKPFIQRIPLETFMDKEDGNDLQLNLTDGKGNALSSSSWIQLNADKREIYGLPLEDAVSRWQYKLIATDNDGASVVEVLDITVQQHKGHRSVNHEISITATLEKEFSKNVDWQIALISGVCSTLNDDSMSSVVVREIRTTSPDARSIVFVYTNDTIPKDKCPEESLQELVNQINLSTLNRNLNSEIKVSSIVGDQTGPCQKITRKTKPTEISRNFPPLTRNPVDKVNAIVGQLLVYKVPSDTFFDPEDGTDLRISLLTSERTALESTHWLQFDSKNQEFFGIPKIGDYGQKEYFLTAEDKEGLPTTDALVVEVNHATKRDYSVLFEITMGIAYESFNSSIIQRRFVEKLATLFQDSDTSNILIRSIRHIHHSGNTLITFFNTTLHRQNNKCPENQIQILKNILLHHDSSIRDNVKEMLGFEFNILKINMVPIGTCQNFDTIHHEFVPVKTNGDNDLEIYKEDYLLTYILPTSIILIMLLISFLITCILYKRRQSGKIELGDEEERKTFRSKGIPVIFQDELDERPDMTNNPPIILKNEKPPLLSQYNGMTADGDNEDLDEYKPPPAVVCMEKEVREKLPATPSYRKPPPYVSP